jgi:hypothetical protein
LDVHRDFTWLFVVTDATHPIIGVNFLSHFGLLVDCGNNRLLEGVTSLAVPTQAASALILSTKTITGVTPIDSLLAEFLNLTRPAAVRPEVRRNTVHHIPDYNGTAGHLQITATVTGTARYRQSRVRRHVVAWHSPLVREFLVFGATGRAP